MKYLHFIFRPSNGSEPSPGLNLTQSSHDRAHTEGVPDTQNGLKQQQDKEKDNFPMSRKRQKSVAQDEEEDKKTSVTNQSSLSRPSQHTPGPSRDIIVPPSPFQFSDPCPKSMRHVRIGDLSSVDINWKMLTLARPTSKIDEDIFSK